MSYIAVKRPWGTLYKFRAAYKCLTCYGEWWQFMGWLNHKCKGAGSD